jgi:hypothetical protein
MRKLIFKVTEPNEKPYGLEFITDKSPEWTEEQFTRHRYNCKMELISNENTEEKESVSRKVKLG